MNEPSIAQIVLFALMVLGHVACFGGAVMWMLQGNKDVTSSDSVVPIRCGGCGRAIPGRFTNARGMSDLVYRLCSDCHRARQDAAETLRRISPTHI